MIEAMEKDRRYRREGVTWVVLERVDLQVQEVQVDRVNIAAVVPVPCIRLWVGLSGPRVSVALVVLNQFVCGDHDAVVILAYSHSWTPWFGKFKKCTWSAFGLRLDQSLTLSKIFKLIRPLGNKLGK
jgi:hypothetical protein